MSCSVILWGMYEEFEKMREDLNAAYRRLWKIDEKVFVAELACKLDSSYDLVLKRAEARDELYQARERVNHLRDVLRKMQYKVSSEGDKE